MPKLVLLVLFCYILVLFLFFVALLGIFVSLLGIPLFIFVAHGHHFMTFSLPAISVFLYVGFGY